MFHKGYWHEATNIDISFNNTLIPHSGLLRSDNQHKNVREAGLTEKRPYNVMNIVIHLDKNSKTKPFQAERETKTSDSTSFPSLGAN